MTSTLDLLQKALSEKSAADWSRHYNITQATFTNAKARGHLSPALAGNIAIDLGENASKWIAIAALEAERESPLLERLRKDLKSQNP